ncbi:hypothetical protein SAMD00024442_341_3 [Candidatus Symbiothrix dinenymphae]|nr:hypothetical protein SAMD00024442_341_3 [Candidatus Symbiothrix dinenymphae]
MHTADEMEETKTVHIGEAIRQKMKERGMRVSDFAKAIHCERSNVYTSIFRCQSINTERLKLISEVLHYAFVSEMCLNRPSTKKYIILLEVTEQQLQKYLSDPSFPYVKEVL